MTLKYYHRGVKVPVSQDSLRGEWAGRTASWLPKASPQKHPQREKGNAVKFMCSYAQTHAILLPGRIPGYKRDDLQLLPSRRFVCKKQNNTETNLFCQAVWELYKEACIADDLRFAAYNTFCTLWRNLLTHITIMKPMTDLCSVYQQNSANREEEEKSEVQNHKYYLQH